MAIKMLFGADIYPARAFQTGFLSGDINDLVDEQLKDVLLSSDFRFFNLEAPIADGVPFIEKAGPKLCVGTDTVPGLLSLKPDLLGLGNNHILDCGELGFKRTIECLNGNNISFTGAGENIREAERPYVIDYGNVKIGIYNCEEHIACYATNENAGAAPYDPLRSFDIVRKLKKECSFVFVIFHGGKENYQYPTPELQRICRYFIDCGADAVICQHSHCVGCEERYHGGYINYGQGNFFYDMKGKLALYAILLCFYIDNNTNIKVEAIPIARNNNKMALSCGEQKATILSSYYERSRMIMENGFVESEFIRLASRLKKRYLMWMIGEKKLYRFFNRLSRNQFINDYYSLPEARRLLNTVSCRSHRELLEQVIKNSIK